MMSHSRQHRIPLSPLRAPASRLLLARASVLLAVVIALSIAAYRASVAAPPTRSAIREAPGPGLVTSFGERRSHNGRYTAEIGDTSPVAIDAAQSWTLHLSRRGRRVSHATVAATAWMPNDTVRSPAAPSVRYVGGGDYRIDEIVFTKAGWWNVALVIDGDRGMDSVAFNVVIPPAFQL